jgi:hypothetical protein
MLVVVSVSIRWSLIKHEDGELRSRRPMASFQNLTGRWIGQYEQRGKEYPISAEFVQDGENLTGVMRDGQPDRDCSLFEATVEAGLPPGADEQIDANIRAMNPDAPSAPIRTLSHVHPVSRLVGRCEGQIISFVKSYMGSSFHGYKIGDKIVGQETEGHEVQYSGRLSADGLEVEGFWWIDADLGRAWPRADGLFSLRREDDAQRS